MLDINKIRENKEEIKKSLLKRLNEDEFDLDKVISLDDKRKKLLTEVEELKKERNKRSKVKPDEKDIQELKLIGDKVKKIDEEIKEIKKEIQNNLFALPNIVASDVPPGGKESNQVIKTFKEKPKHSPKDHIQLASDLDIIDYKRAAKMAGSGFWIYKNEGALLEWALLNYFIDFHRKNGYTFLIPPFLLNEKSAYTSGHLPKFRDDLFWTQDNLCLNATSEMMLANYHRDEILNGSELPLKYFAYSPCFRREAGAYRKEERGMIRGHQFNKIEMFQFVLPGESWKTFEELLENAEKLTADLGLHFQSSLLAAGDASVAMAKTVDIEVWIPSMGIYKEVSSVSNALDYQARRGNIKYREKKTNKTYFVHTLNASGLATSRLIPAILEQFQQEDGSVKVPEALHPYLKLKTINARKKNSN